MNKNIKSIEEARSQMKQILYDATCGYIDSEDIQDMNDIIDRIIELTKEELEDCNGPHSN